MLLLLLLLPFSDSPIKKLYKLHKFLRSFFSGNILIKIYQDLFEELKILQISVLVLYNTQVVPTIYENGNTEKQPTTLLMANEFQLLFDGFVFFFLPVLQL